LNYHRLTG